VPQLNHGKVQQEKDKGDGDAFDEAEAERTGQHKERHKRFGYLVQARNFGPRLESKAALDEARRRIRRERQAAERDA